MSTALDVLLPVLSGMTALIMSVPFLFILIHACVPKFRQAVCAPDFRPEIACIVTAYKDAEVALPLVNSLLAQPYPADVYVVADRCRSDAVIFPENEKLHLLFPPTPLDSKVKSLLYAFTHMTKKYDYVMVLDPDNVVSHDTLTGMVPFLEKYDFVQGKRVAKNLDSPVANLDAMGEIFYNFITREIPFRCGSSATIAGSGMMLKADFYRQHLENLLEKFENQLISAEDKLLQMEIVGEGHTIAFAQNSLIYDEKISGSHQIKNQRTRWLLSYFNQVKESAGVLLKGILKADFNRILFAAICLFPPQSVLVFGWSLLLMASLLTGQFMSAAVLAGALAVYAFSYLGILAIGRAPASVYRSLPALPVLLWNMLRAMLQLQKAKKDFLLTEKKKAPQV